MKVMKRKYNYCFSWPYPITYFRDYIIIVGNTPLIVFTVRIPQQRACNSRPTFTLVSGQQPVRPVNLPRTGSWHVVWSHTSKQCLQLRTCNWHRVLMHVLRRDHGIHSPDCKASCLLSHVLRYWSWLSVFASHQVSRQNILSPRLECSEFDNMPIL